MKSFGSLVLASLIGMGFLLYSARSSHRLALNTYKSLILEARFLQAQLREASLQLRMDLAFMPYSFIYSACLLHNRRLPALPFLRGQRDKFQIVVAPHYLENPDSPLRKSGEQLTLKGLSLLVRISPVGSNTIADALPTELLPSQLNNFWNTPISSAQRAVLGLQRYFSMFFPSTNTKVCREMIKSLCHRSDLLMRVASVRRYADFIQAVIKYPHAPRVMFKNSEFRALLDATSLKKILYDLLQIAKMGATTSGDLISPRFRGHLV